MFITKLIEISIGTGNVFITVLGRIRIVMAKHQLFDGVRTLTPKTISTTA